MHHHRLRIGLVLGAVVFLVAGTLWASNMGFLINCTLFKATPGVSLSGVNTVSLPYQQSSVASAEDLMREIGFSSVASVARFLESQDALHVYTGTKGSAPDFSINPGECYFAKMRTTTDYVIEGAHKPGLALPLDVAGPGASRSGTNFVSLPYHSCALTAKQLMDDIGFSSVVSVARYLTTTDTLQTYTGRKGSGAEFPLSPCECYFVKMAAPVSYIPSHY